MNIWIAVALLFAAAAEEPSPRGRLCLGERRTTLAACTNTTGLEIAVEPAEKERLFVWTSADGATAHVGVIAPKAAAVKIDPAGASTMRVSIDTARAPLPDVTISVAGKEQWRWVLDPKSAVRLRRIVVPRGRYSIRLVAEHHRTLTRGQIAAMEEAVDLGELRLQPLPAARGTVVDAEEKPVAEAIVMRPDGSTCATSNEQGAFVCELREPFPEALVVSKAGYGPRELQLEREIDADVDLGRVVLGRGRKLALTIVLPEEQKASVALWHDAERRYDHSKLKSHELTAREQEVEFDVAQGKYLVVIEGDEPFERLETPIEIKDEDVSRTITVEPFRVVGSVLFGEDPLQEGTMEVIAPEHSWRVTLPVQNGAFHATMWQRGTLAAFVSSKPLGISELVQSPALGDDPSRWDVRIAKRMIVGRVFDAETKEPVSRAELSLTAEMEGGAKFYTSVKIDPDGSYRILAARPGTYSIRVSSAEHVPHMTDLRITAEERTRTHDVALERGVMQPLEIVTPAGAPIANAHLLEGVQPDRVNPQFMYQADAAGRFALRGRPGETRLLYVVPRDGSFAVVRVQIPRSSDAARPVQVVVAPGVGSLRVRSVDADEKLAPRGLLFRYNGEFVPGAIARFALGEMPGTGPTGEAVLSRLPAGAYELWALGGPADEEAIIASGGTLRTPVRVGLSAGEQSVTLAAPPLQRPPRRAP